MAPERASGRHGGNAANLLRNGSRHRVSLNDGAPRAAPGPMRWPGRICSKLVPSPGICVCTAMVAPLPRVTMVITALTPITMPKMVRNERSRLRRMERSASKNGVQKHQCPSCLRCTGRPRAARAQHNRARCGVSAVEQAILETHDAPRIRGHLAARAVTISTVMPCSLLSFHSNSMISSLRWVSRLPVGSSASSTTGLLTIARCNRHALLLAAR